MDFARLLDELGYADSPHFLRKGSTELRTAPEFGHVFRKATAKPCHLEGVYTLKRNPQSKTEPPVPVVYVCRADSEEAAHNVHRLVWNQDVVPFLLLHSPRGFRLYSGFRCQPQKEGLERGVLKGLTRFNAISELAESFHADAIDCGKLWLAGTSSVLFSLPNGRVMNAANFWRIVPNMFVLVFIITDFSRAVCFLLNAISSAAGNDGISLLVTDSIIRFANGDMRLGAAASFAA